MRRVRLGSAAIEAVSYDETKRILVVEFRGGDSYQYLDVPKTAYRELLKAESAGAFRNEVKDRFSYARFPSARFSTRVGDAKKQKTRHVFTHRVFSSGDVLLSHGLSPYYHRGCSVSLPCSEWERVVPPRYCHQSAEPHWRFRCFRSDASARPNLWSHVDLAIDN